MQKNNARATLCPFLVFFVLFFCIVPRSLYGNAHEPQSVFTLSLEELMETEIVLPSKKKELLFDSPLGASVLTAEEIRRSGALSIPEALRLIPGIIVREQSSGNYDVHIRGFDNIPPDSLFPLSSNSLTLVMVDNRVVYNYFQGGTFWETLPISVHDVERIELIRGPSAALYGPNAVSGVINIITKRPQKKGWSLQAHAERGTFNTKNGYAGFFYNRKRIKAGLSINSIERDRHESEYYEFERGRYIADPEDIISFAGNRRFENPQRRYPEQHRALERLGINTFVDYHPKDDIQIGISGGYQNSRAQKIYVDNRATPLTTNDSDSTYLHIKGKIGDFSAICSLTRGDQDTLGVTALQYDYTTVDISAEYDIRWGKLSIMPGFNYRNAAYRGDFINGRQCLTTKAFSLRAEYNITDALSLIAAVRADFYNRPNDRYISFQLAATYKLTSDRLLRAVYSRSNRAPFFLDTYTDFEVHYPGRHLYYEGNRNLDLLVMDMLELGCRFRVYKGWFLDVEAFLSRSKDYDDNQLTASRKSIMGSINTFRFKNLDIEAVQAGMTGSLSWSPGAAMHIKVFGTLQRTWLDDVESINGRKQDTRHRATPTFYGGLYIQYLPHPKLSINTNAYWYTHQTFDHEIENTSVDKKIIANVKISYKLTSAVSIFLNARNLFGDSEKEFAFADDVRGVYLTGMDICY